jgi:hypothetical protein
MTRRKLTAKRVRELLDCDPIIGTLTWKFRPDGPRQWNTKYAGKPAGTCIGNDGYARIRIDSKPRAEPNGNRDDRYSEIWQIFHGDVPVTMTGAIFFTTELLDRLQAAGVPALRPEA